MLFEKIIELGKNIDNSASYTEVRQDKELINLFKDRWAGFQLLRSLPSEYLKPKDFKPCEIFEQSYEKVKHTTGVDKFYYILDYLRLKNHIIYDEVSAIMVKVLDNE